MALLARAGSMAVLATMVVLGDGGAVSAQGAAGEPKPGTLLWSA